MVKKFKLLFLGENEEYIRDVGCTVDARVADTNNISSFSLTKLIKSGGLRGRIRIGSQSVFLDLDGIDDFLSVPFHSIEDVVSVGSECLRIRASVMRTFPISIIGNKTRLVKPVFDDALRIELLFTIHNTYLGEITRLIQQLHEHTVNDNTEGVKTFLKSIHESLDQTFDLTSLSSHREILLLTKPLRVSRIKKMLEVRGIVQLSKQYMYFQPRATLGSVRAKKFALSSFGTSTLYAQRVQRYKLKDSCVEFEFSNGKNLLLQFDSRADRSAFLNALKSTQTVANGPSLPSLEMVTERWRNCEVSNFDYLMYLNHLSGRSLNDIGQYPIFPWTLCNMTSVSIDLTDPKNFRDLGTPVAATNKAKLEQSRSRALQMSANERFLFGSFYSNPAFVLYFLIRQYPECHLRLHGGHFDHTARLFTSLKGSWEAIADSGSATMELIPEFYSDFDGATKWMRNLATMTNVPELVLPDWAASPSDFVIKMRCALESPIVSSKLHLWIDLVFGVKSRGREICFENNNLFHPICYLTDVEGDVIDYCHDNEEAQKNIVLLQSQEFGHVPTQLFPLDAHPQRDVSQLKPEWYSESFYKNGGARDPWRSVISSLSR
jgi:hypothetical protein